MKNTTHLALILVGTFACHILFVALFKGILGYAPASIISSSVIIALFVLTPLRGRLTELAASIFIRPGYDYHKVLRESVKALVTILDLDKLLSYFLQIIVNNIKPAKAALFLFIEDKGVFRPFSSHNIPKGVVDNFQLSEQDEMVEWFKKTKEIFVKAHLRRNLPPAQFDLLFARFDILGAELIVPFFYKEELVGILSLSKKEDGSNYSRSDLEILDALSDEAAIAIENARLYTEAITDGLTRLYHHRYFQHRLFEEVERTKRYHSPLSLVMLDIDHFKDFNDKYGHQAGDAILKDIAKILKASIRVTDLSARYGGEEFAIILTSTPRDGAAIAAERVRSKIQNHKMRYRENDIGVTISCGIADYDGMDRSFTKEQLIREADLALYKAKESGRNRVELFAAMLAR